MSSVRPQLRATTTTSATASSSSSTRPSSSSFSAAEDDRLASAVENAFPLLTDLSAARDVARLVGKYGAKAEYQEFADSTKSQAGGTNAFDFIKDACEGTGGFRDGRYLDAHTREVSVYNALTPVGMISGGTSNSRGNAKYQRRKTLADYDNFCRTIRDTLWGYVQQAKDLIKHDSDLPELQHFWRNADGAGTDIVDFFAVPWREARSYTFNVIVVDRPELPDNATAADTSSPETAPYAFSVPSKNVVWWEFDETEKSLELLAYLEPEEPEPGAEDTAPDFSEPTPAPLKIWTRSLWATFIPVKTVEDGGASDSSSSGRGASRQWTYALERWRAHPVGEVPAVILYDDPPSPGQLFASTEMREVAILAKTVYNLDSEKREIQRNCAFPILCIPTKEPGSVDKIVLSTEGALGFDGPGTPAYLTADLDALVKIAEDRQAKIDAAFGMAHLAAVVGSIQTTSGFHTLAEFDKTNRRLGRGSAQLEDADMKLAWIVLRWHGYEKAALDDAFAHADDTNPPPYSITYPRDFGLRDSDVLVDRATKLLELDMGEPVDREIYTDLLSSLWPRLPKTKIEAMVGGAVSQAATRKENERQAMLAMANANANAMPSPVQMSARVQQLLQRAGGKNQKQIGAAPPPPGAKGAPPPPQMPPKTVAAAPGAKK